VNSIARGLILACAARCAAGHLLCRSGLLVHSRLGLSLSFVPVEHGGDLDALWLRQRVAISAACAGRSSRRSPGAAAAGSPRKGSTRLKLVGSRFGLPFLGVWTARRRGWRVPHQGALRHAFDFEGVWRPRWLALQGRSQRRVDYRSLRAAGARRAVGTVRGEEYEVPKQFRSARVAARQALGQLRHVSARRRLVLSGGALAPHTVAVYVGQFVRRGALLGYFGKLRTLAAGPHL
jgi:hypothetical protein